MIKPTLGLMRNMLGAKLLLVLLMAHTASCSPLDKVNLEEDTPSPPVILEDSSQYTETGTEEYLDYEYSSSVEKELKEIHKILFRNDNATDLEESTNNSDSSIINPTQHVLQDRDRKELDLDEFIRQDPNFDFEPVGVEITAVVSHSPDQSQDLSEGEVSTGEDNLDNTANNMNATELVVKEPLDDLTLALTWWQILLLIAASLLLASLCCYFSGCCFLTSDCCADPFWGCCPCCYNCVRYTKPPPHTPKSSHHDREEGRARSNYSLNENTTAPRSTIDRTTISTVRLEPDESGIGKVNGSRNGRTPLKPGRGSSRTSVRNNQMSGQNSLASNTSIHSSRPYTRRHSHNNSFRNSSGILVPGARAGNSLHASSRSITKVEDSLKMARKESVLLRGEPSKDWVYEDSSGYFSWISRLGSGKKKQYSVYEKSKNKSSQKNKNNKYRQSKYEHIADMRNSAVIPMKISKRASNASNFNIRPMRARSVESMSSADEDCIQPFLHTKTESTVSSVNKSGRD